MHRRFNALVMTPVVEMSMMEVFHEQEDKNQKDQKSPDLIKEIKHFIYHGFSLAVNVFFDSDGKLNLEHT
jgi:hypothetical protein